MIRILFMFVLFLVVFIIGFLFVLKMYSLGKESRKNEAKPIDKEKEKFNQERDEMIQKMKKNNK